MWSRRGLRWCGVALNWTTMNRNTWRAWRPLRSFIIESLDLIYARLPPEPTTSSADDVCYHLHLHIISRVLDRPKWLLRFIYMISNHGTTRHFVVWHMMGWKNLLSLYVLDNGRTFHKKHHTACLFCFLVFPQGLGHYSSSFCRPDSVRRLLSDDCVKSRTESIL